jgi:hypothetical protein
MRSTKSPNLELFSTLILPKKFSETDIFNMLEFLLDNIFVMFGGRVFQQTVGIPKEERDLDCMYSNRSFEFFRIHI